MFVVEVEIVRKRGYWRFLLLIFPGILLLRNKWMVGRHHNLNGGRAFLQGSDVLSGARRGQGQTYFIHRDLFNMVSLRVIAIIPKLYCSRTVAEKI